MRPSDTHASTRAITVVIAAVIIAVVMGFGQLAACTTSSSRPSSSTSASSAASHVSAASQNSATYTFRTSRQLNEHFDKHGREMGFTDAKSYEAAASAVVTNPNSLHKLEKEDNDDVYYLEATDEFVIVSPDGYIRTYFNPGGIDYFNRQ